MPEVSGLVVFGIILLGGVVGFLSGLFGVGGGFLLVPMLNIAFGVPMNVAVGSSLCQMIGTATTATVRHWKESVVDVKLALILLGGTLGGVEIGTMLIQDLRKLGTAHVFGRDLDWGWLVWIGTFVVILAVIGAGTLVESWRHHRTVADGGTMPRRVGRGLFNRVNLPPIITCAGTEGKRVPLLLVIFLGFGVGVLKGFIGVGGGIIFMPTLIYWVGCSTRMAVGTSLIVVVLSSVAGTVSHALRGNVSLALVSLLLVSSTTGAYFGATFHHRLKPHHVRLYFSLVVLAVLVVILVHMLWTLVLWG